MQARFHAEHTALANVLRSAGGDDDLAAAVDSALSTVQDGQSDWETLLAEGIAAVASTSGQRLIRQLRTSAPELADIADYDANASAGSGEVASLTNEYVPQLAASISATTHDRLSELLHDALNSEEGATLADLLDSVKQQYDTWSADDGRASTIADSTTVQGWEAGAYDAAEQATADTPGVEVIRTWNAVMDAHTRPEHADADGQQVGLHDTFTVGGEDLMYPGDPSASPGNCINCRCTVSYDVAASSAKAWRRRRRKAFRAFREVTLG